MSDLRGAIRDLRNVARRLDAATFNPDMNALTKFVEGLKIVPPAQPPEDVLKPLLAKFLRGERDFSSREIRVLPFIIYEPSITPHHTIEILRQLDFSRASHIKRVSSIYLLNYNDSNKTEVLRQTLNRIGNVDSVSLKKIFAARDKLFGNERFTNMARLFADTLSVEASLNTIGLSNFYKASNFIQVSLAVFFRRSPAPLDDQFKLLDELDSEFDTYKNIFPYVADAMIQAVACAGFNKRKCMEIFYRRLGDPRFGDSRFNWDKVSQKSKEIFCHWLSEEDLETFFELIRQTAVDSMWRYREKFWRAYLPYVTKTKIFLGTTARNVAAKLENIKLYHGTLEKAENNQSVFIFQIGQYIFSEWSHNGMLRVHKEDSAGKWLSLFDLERNFFEYDSIDRDDLIDNALLEQIHYSPKTYSWQTKVSDWLCERCNINKTMDDWGLES